MQKVLSNSQIDVYIIILTIQLLQAQCDALSCFYVKEGIEPLHNEQFPNISLMNLNNSCSITITGKNCLPSLKILSHDIHFSSPILDVSMNNLAGAYVNVTIDFEFALKTNRLLLQEGFNGTCWNIEINEDDRPSYVVILNLPVPVNFTGLTAASIFSDESSLHNDCDISKKSCKLFESVLNFSPSSAKKSMKLKINVADDSEYEIQLLSGECNVTCEGIKNNCSVQIRSEVLQFDVQETREFVFYNLTPAYYCARIGSDSCCVIHTETKRLEGQTNITVVVIRDPKHFYTITLIILLIMLIILVLIIYIAKYKLPRITSRPCERDCVISLMSEHLTPVHQLIEDMKQSIEVYLVYTYESDEFLKLMSSFRQLLSCFVKRVYDPYSERDIEDVSNNIPSWIQSVLQNPMIQVIIVESKQAFEMEKMCLEGANEELQINKHFLQIAFPYTLACLRNDIHLIFDYSRTYVVRLDSSLNSQMSILPCARYNIPDHFETLIYHLSRQISQSRNINFEDFSKIKLWSIEKEDFIEAQLKFNLNKD